MNNNENIRNFQIQYFKWSLVDSMREVEGFPLLKTFAEGPAPRLIQFLTRLHKQQQVRYLEALVKKAHRSTLPLVNAEFNAEDRRLCEECSEAIMNPTGQELLAWEAEVRTGVYPAQQRAPQRDIASVASAFIGDPIRYGDDGIVTFERRCGLYTIQTLIDIGGQHHKLSYEHLICYGDMRLKSGVSILSWLGLSSQTAWARYDSSSVHSLVMVCSHFLKCFDDLLNVK